MDGVTLQPFSKDKLFVFSDLTKQGIVLPYMDDLVILSIGEHETLSQVRIVLSLAKVYRLEINFKKFHFLKNRIGYLGHVAEDNKIYPSEAKTIAVLRFPETKNLKQVQSFLGLGLVAIENLFEFIQSLHHLAIYLRKIPFPIF